MMKAAIIVLEWPGSIPWSAPRRRALGTKSHAWAVPCCSRWESSVIGSLEIGVDEIDHGYAP
jgi:hypothetical protein